MMRVLLATPTRFRAEDDADDRFYIEGRLTAGTLTFEIRTKMPDGRRGNLSGRTLWDAMIGHFGRAAVAAVKAVWTEGIDLDTNLDAFNAAAGPPDHHPPPEAARLTWTGNRALDLGLTDVTFLMLVGKPGSYSDVVALFTAQPRGTP